MVVSRNISFLKLCKTFRGKRRLNESAHMIQQIRWHSDGLFYRKFLKAAPGDEKLATVYGGFFWWWMTYNILTADYEELFGPIMPDPSKWTDEELGIPSVYE